MFLACVVLSVSQAFSDVFDDKLDRVRIDIEKILGCPKRQLERRLVFHPIKYRFPVPLHARTCWIMFEPEEERKIASEMVRQLKPSGAFYHSERDEERVRAIAEKVISALPTSIKLEFYLADTEQVNAFCLIDGTLVVTKGALKELSDRELAFVIAHEYGHAIARHGAEGLTKAIASETIQKRFVDPYAEKQAEEEDGKWKELFIKVGYSLVANLGIRLPYSRMMENEADALGLVYMTKAGYDPQGAVDFFQHLQKLEGNSEAEWSCIGGICCAGLLRST